LLAGSEYEPPTIALAAAVGTILQENAMPFFPAFTDHGTRHVERVLEAIARLIPEEVWRQGLLQSLDAAVVLGATLLHDLAMHVHRRGFVELVAERSRFEARPWFSRQQSGRAADAPWCELWRSFQREARHFGTSQLELLLGAAAAHVPRVAYQEELAPETWSEGDHLLIGEFLRRHHARLGHEIALYGFPGTDDREFPVLADVQPQLAEAVGLVARSHGESLRQMLAYVKYLEPGSKRPGGALLVYHMGLLRVADYLQIEAERAPPLLLRLKTPQSPLSIAEWDKHGAVSAISWDHSDPLAISVSVSASHGLRTHLALRELLESLQRELDTTAAVLSQTYPSSELAALRLTRQRVLSNLDEPSLHDRLPYIPRRAALRSGPDLFRLVIRYLYGNQPSVAGRELLQNAVDAVRARRLWEQRCGASAVELRELAADVVVTLEDGSDEQCLLRVADRGIGMTPAVAIEYFMQAGASYGLADVELDELDRDALLLGMKTGRFGIGAFAAFLLGPEIRVTTRHVEAARGISFTARIDQDLVEVRWCEAPVGTEIVVPFDDEVVWQALSQSRAVGSLLDQIAVHYRLRDPNVIFEHKTGEGDVRYESAPRDVPLPSACLPDDWRDVPNSGMDAVLWRLPARFREGYMPPEGSFTHNGMAILDLEYRQGAPGSYEWSSIGLTRVLNRPDVAVFDSQNLLQIALNRYWLVERALPFESQLLESIGLDLVAHALVAGARNHPLLDDRKIAPILSPSSWMPFLPSLMGRLAQEPLLVVWYESEDQPWLPENALVDGETQLASRDPLGSQGFTHRMYIKIDGTPDDDDEDFREMRRWGYTLDSVEDAVEESARRLGASPLATAVVRGAGARPGRAEITRWDVCAYAENATSRARAGTFLNTYDGRSSPGAPVVEELVAAARALKADGRQASAALTLYSDFPGVEAAEERLAVPWMRIVGGGLPRERHAAQEASRRILEANPSLRPLVARWQRLLNKAA
jgi:molecular chaperone HtpG